MVCVQCGRNTQVINSRLQKRNNKVWRRRKCLNCGTVFSTQEIIQYENTWIVVDSSGNFSPFSVNKLLLSLNNSCRHRPTSLSDAAALSDTIIKKLLQKHLNTPISSRLISQVSQVALNRFDKAASVHYAANHQ